MKSRKPRYAKYELERLPIRELKTLLGSKRKRAPPFSDKRDLIEYLLRSGAVDEIASPPPVEFPNKAVLRAMGVSKLRKTLNESGVFFDPKDVIEKEDMVRIFVNSGRVVFSELEAPVEEETEANGEPYEDTTKSTQLVDDTFLLPASTAAASSDVPVVETVVENHTFEDGENPEEANRSAWTSDLVMEERLEDVPDMGETSELPRVGPQENTSFEATEAQSTTVSAAEGQSTTASVTEDLMATVERSEGLGGNDEDLISAGNSEASGRNDISFELEVADSSTNDTVHATSAQTDADFHRSMALAQAASVIHDRSVSEIRAFAETVDVDISNCSDREDMVNTLLKAAEGRPQLASYLLALAPLAGQSVSQLRALARSLGVRINDCLEKGEIIHRLASSVSGRSS